MSRCGRLLYQSLSSAHTPNLSQPPPRTSYPSRELDVLLHYRDPFGVDGAQVRVFEQVHHERLGGFLERLYRLALPAQGVAVDGEEGETDFADLDFFLHLAAGRGGGEKFQYLSIERKEGTYEAGEWEFQKE